MFLHFVFYKFEHVHTAFKLESMNYRVCCFLSCGTWLNYLT